MFNDSKRSINLGNKKQLNRADLILQAQREREAREAEKRKLASVISIQVIPFGFDSLLLS